MTIIIFIVVVIVSDLISSFLQKLECPKVKGQLLIFGATNWDLIGRKEVPKQQGRIFYYVK